MSVTDIEIIEKRRELELLKKRNRLRKDNGLLCYRPHEKQQWFHAHGDYKYRYVRTGNRFGKSDMGAAEDVAWAVGARLWLPPDDPNYDKGIPKRPTKGLIIAIDWDKCEEIFTNEADGLGRGKIWKFLPKARYVTHHRNHSGRVDCITVESMHGGNSTIYFDTVQSFMKNRMSQESSNWDWVHIDEPIPEDMWKGVSRGLVDAGGSAWFCCTPLNQPWINDFFLPNAVYEPDMDKVNYFDKKKVVIVGSMFDNPYLDKENISDYEETLTEDERQCRIHGVPLAMAGMVYKEFNHNTHIFREAPHGWKDISTPPDDYAIYYAIDPHPRTPHAVLFAAVAPTGEIFFYRELFEASYIAELSANIRQIVDGKNVVKAICDPIAYLKNPVDETTMADEFFANGVFFEKATKDLSRGILESKAELAKPRRLYFSENLHRTIWEFEHYVWDQEKGKPVDKDDHMMECFYRLILTGLEYVPVDDESGSYFPQTTVDHNFDVFDDIDTNFSRRADFAARYPR